MTDSPQLPSLAVRVAKSAGWIVAWRMSSRLLGIVNTIVLVRLLVPADFGLVTLATGLSQAIEGLVAMGVNEALIRNPESDRALYDTGFTMNVLRSSFVAACIVAGAWPAGQFFNDPRLSNILLILAGLTMVAAFENVGVVEFRRKLTFDKEFVVLVIPRVVGILVSISFAAMLRNYWALIASIGVAKILRVILTYWMHPYRPGLTLIAWRRLIGFSFWTWLLSIVVLIKDRADSISIGRVLSPAKVGVYAVGLEIGTLATTELLEPLSTALFAGLSAGRREGMDITQWYLRAVSVTLMLTIPVGVGISLISAPVIVMMFGRRWLEAIPIVQVFALLGVTRVIPTYGSVMLSSQGKLQVLFRITVVTMVVRLVLLLALIKPFGLMGVVAAAASCAAVEEILFLIVTFRMFNLRIVSLLRATWRGLAAAAAMALVLYLEGIGWAPAAPDTGAMLRDILIGTASGAVTYFGVLLATWALSGRPDGAEAMFLSFAYDTWYHAAGKRIGGRA